MRRFSAQYLITGTGQVLRRAIVTVNDNGIINHIENTSGDLQESSSVEFFNGIIIPGFVNCHCHLELSPLKGEMPEGEGLGRFIEKIRTSRQAKRDDQAIKTAETEMIKGGIVLCADICNSDDTFEIKKKGRIKYLNLIEIFGIDPEKSQKRIDEALALAQSASSKGLSWFFTPHSSYSVSLPLLRRIKELSNGNKVTSIHFMESSAEKEYLEKNSGSLKDSYERSGLLPARPDHPKDHCEVILKEVTSSGNLLLVHNTFADDQIISELKERKNLYWCICPGSNLYIEKKLPPVSLLKKNRCDIVLGTDSLASNKQLSIIEELIKIQLNFPETSFEELVSWATINGARALCNDAEFGSIEPGKKPGVLLISDADLVHLKLTKESFVTRLI